MPGFGLFLRYWLALGTRLRTGLQSNVLFVGSVVCLLVGRTTEAVPIGVSSVFIGATAPTAIIVVFIHQRYSLF